jgi:hypothetical protein
MAEACAKRAWAGRADLHYRHLDGVQGCAECCVSSSLPDTSVAEPIGHHHAFRKTPTSCKSLKVAETGSSDSVTLGLLLASLESLFYQRMAISLKSLS